MLLMVHVRHMTISQSCSWWYMYVTWLSVNHAPDITWSCSKSHLEHNHVSMPFHL